MLGGEALDKMLRYVPQMDLQVSGDCVQANGIDLPVVAINLARRSDRWQTLTQRMAAAGFTKLIRAPAVEGAHLPDDSIAALLGAPAEGVNNAPRSHLTLTRPAIGCFLSHLAIWRWVIAQDVPSVLVLEDDAAPTNDFSVERLDSVLADLHDRRLILAGRVLMHGLGERSQGEQLARIYYFNGTFAYLITPAACRALLPHLLPLRFHIDHQISRTLIDQRRVFPAYSAEPPLFEPDWSLRSDCYVPLADESTADCEFGEILEATRRLLLEEGRPLVSISA
jgi:GR25 family glycosyltransferase involved in LPS biosynthesis